AQEHGGCDGQDLSGGFHGRLSLGGVFSAGRLGNVFDPPGIPAAGGRGLALPDGPDIDLFRYCLPVVNLEAHQRGRSRAVASRSRSSEDAHTESVSTFEELEHLGAAPASRRAQYIAPYKGHHESDDRILGGRIALRRP